MGRPCGRAGLGLCHINGPDFRGHLSFLPKLLIEAWLLMNQKKTCLMQVFLFFSNEVLIVGRRQKAKHWMPENVG